MPGHWEPVSPGSKTLRWVASYSGEPAVPPVREADGSVVPPERGYLVTRTGNGRLRAPEVANAVERRQLRELRRGASNGKVDWEQAEAALVARASGFLGSSDPAMSAFGAKLLTRIMKTRASLINSRRKARTMSEWVSLLDRSRARVLGGDRPIVLPGVGTRRASGE